MTYHCTFEGRKLAHENRKNRMSLRPIAATACMLSLCLSLPMGSSSTALLTDVASSSAITVSAWTGCLAARYRDEVLATGPEAYLRMVGPAATEANSGSSGSAWSWTATPVIGTGALSCDSNRAATVSLTTWLSSEHTNFIASESTPFSYAFWVKAAPGSQGVLFSSVAERLSTGITSRADRATWITPTGLLGVVLSDGPSTRWVTSANSITDGQWHFIVVTLQVTDTGSGRGTRLYIDGTQVAFGSQMRKGLAPTANESWRVGPATLSADLANLRPTEAFTGQVDEVAVWSSTLTSANVTSLWAARAG